MLFTLASYEAISESAIGLACIVIYQVQSVPAIAPHEVKTYTEELDLVDGPVLRIDGHAFHYIQSRVCTVDDPAEYRVLLVEVRLF